MKIIHLNTYDILGGAARGTYWLHSNLINRGIDSQLFVKFKASKDPSVKQYQSSNYFLQKICNQRQRLNKYTLNRYTNRTNHSFSIASWTPFDFIQYINKQSPDIVHLHWVGEGFLTPEEIGQIKAPIVWTMRDLWAITGGCHYSFGCKKYESACGKCPELKSDKANDISRKMMKRKTSNYKNADIYGVAISDWLAGVARNSSLFSNTPIEVIHNSVDPEVFKPKNRKFCRELFQLPQDKKLIIFCAISPLKDDRKGFQYLKEALSILDEQQSLVDTELVVVGNERNVDMPKLPIKTHLLGSINDDRILAAAYSLGDILVVPSVEEAFGKVVIEGMACGLPCVGFQDTGMTDIIKHKDNGYNAQYLDSNDLATGIDYTLSMVSQDSSISEKVRKYVIQNFNDIKMTDQYINLYNKIISSTLA